MKNNSVTLGLSVKIIKYMDSQETKGNISRETDVREETTETTRCFLMTCGLNMDKGRGEPSGKYLERVRSRDYICDDNVWGEDEHERSGVLDVHTKC